METFFGVTYSQSSLTGMIICMLMSLIIGGLIGLEREIHGHPAGLRTHILVCVGSVLITQVSIHISTVAGSGDPGRISAQIVSGIGFLGAGAIIRSGNSVHGLTTAASVWATAGVGIALGSGPYCAQMGVITASFMMFTLWTLNSAENWLKLRSHRYVLIEVNTQDNTEISGMMMGKIADYGATILSVASELRQQKHTRHYSLRVILPPGFEKEKFLAGISIIPEVISIEIT